MISRSEDKLLEVADEIGKIVFCQTEKILNTCTCISLLSLQVKHSHFLMILGFPLVRWWPFYDYIMFKKVYLCLHIDINFEFPKKNINFSHSLVQFLHTFNATFIWIYWFIV